MNILRSIGIALVVATSISTSAWAAAPNDEQTILQLEQQWIDASTQSNHAFINKLLDENYVNITTRGAIRNKQAVLDARPMPAGSTQTLSEMQVRIHTNVAVVTGINTFRLNMVATPVEVAFSDIFQKQNGSWKLISAHESLRQ
ncbi:nuclear transport factor 2 family protein [Pseudomonas nicosulfuronedens]